MRRNGKRSRGWWAGIPNRQWLIQQSASLVFKNLTVAQLTKTEDDHIGTDNNGAHGRREELANSTQYHDHTHGDVDKPARDNQS